MISSCGVSLDVSTADTIPVVKPLALVGLHSVEWERDTSGLTPCDSARLLLWAFDKEDSLVGAETTAWFSGSVTDTVVRFSLGRESTLDDVTHVESVLPEVLRRALKQGAAVTRAE